MKSKKQTATEVFAEKETAVKNPEIYSPHVKHALELEKIIKQAGKDYEIEKEYFQELFETTGMKIVPTLSGTAIFAESQSYKVREGFVEYLRNLFKLTFHNMVTEKVSYGVSAAFKKLLADADYPYKDKIREAVEITKSYSVKFVALAETAKGRK